MGEKRQEKMLSNPIKYSLGGIGALAILLMILTIIPIKQWNYDETYAVGLFAVDVTSGDTTTTYSYADMDGSMDVIADAGSAAFGLIFVAMILLMAALAMVLLDTVIAAKLPEQYKDSFLHLPLVLAFIAFIFEMSAWANWAEEVTDDAIPFGAQFALAIVVWLLILAFILLLAFAIFQAKQASAEGAQVAPVVVMVNAAPVSDAPTMQPALIPKAEAPQDTGGFCGTCGQARAACTCDPSGAAATVDASGDGAENIGVPMSQ